ncbi:MAG: nucleotidyl transferase AbiEii/AbiGii toxin family protein [Candidatus Omnitrophota bacterium]|jgi:predicted nucleotidyltransferase component of viral defense system
MIHFSEIEQIASESGVPAETIEKDYCITWILTALFSKAENKDIVFYGGTAIKKVYFPDYRFSEDLDFISQSKLETDDILDRMERVYADIKDEANIILSTDRATVKIEGDRSQFFITYDGFPEISLDKRIKIDVMSRGEFLQKPVVKSLHCGYSDMKKLRAKLLVYAPEAIVTDKIATILSPIRAEPRDLYDLWFLFKNCRLDPKAIRTNFKKKFGYGLKPETVMPNLHNTLYKDRWNNRLSNQIANLPDFNKVLRETEESLEGLS